MGNGEWSNDKRINSLKTRFKKRVFCFCTSPNLTICHSTNEDIAVGLEAND
jgi:hypothetical protein